MASITLKNIPDDVYEMLKARARANHRSINSEIIYSLKRVLGVGERQEVDEILNQARRIRQRVRDEVNSSNQG
jgi:plasmid stability protein